MIFRRRTSALTGRRRPRAQAAVEFALIAPAIVVYVIALVLVWNGFQRWQVYSSAAGTLGEWVARVGTYTPEMGASIQDMMSTNLGVNASDAYLSILVVDSETGDVIDSIGETPPIGVNNPSAPVDDGWGSVIETIPIDDMIVIDIWGVHAIGIPQYDLAYWLVPDGHVAMRSQWGG